MGRVRFVYIEKCCSGAEIDSSSASGRWGDERLEVHLEIWSDTRCK